MPFKGAPHRATHSSTRGHQEWNHTNVTHGIVPEEGPTSQLLTTPQEFQWIHRSLAREVQKTNFCQKFVLNFQISKVSIQENPFLKDRLGF
jgi:hypothetical protein